ncbi:MAG: DOMON domain-containing protein [Desulfobacterium sp.]|nr:DOMON domain-containing protein [Desulfobacterium sp.]
MILRGLIFFFFLPVLLTPGFVQGQEEFDHMIKVETLTFEWRLAGESLHVMLSAKTKGWVGIGFNPSKEMKDGNFILGYVKKGKVTISDHFGFTARQHKSDTKLGGKKNVSDAWGAEEGGRTAIRFTIPLNSGDDKDREIFINKDNLVLLAHGAGRDSLKGKHKFKTVLKVNLQTGVYEKLK